MADAEPTVTAPPNPADAPQAPAAPIMPVAIFKKRGAKGKANLRKRPATPPPAAASDSGDNSSDFSSSEDEATGQRVRKRRKRNPAVAAAGVVTAVSSAQDGKIHKGGEEGEDPTTATVFKADRKLDLESGKREATKHANWFDDEDLSAKNLLGSTRKVPPAKKDAAAAGTSTTTEEQAQPKRNIGPVKPPPSHIRTITITDMAPDVCKDWKQTGFCGFGDGCKFLHAREDYAYGWQLDKEWEKVTKGKKVLQGTIVSSAERKATGRRLGAGEEGDDDDDDGAEEAMLEAIPFACILCRGPYKSPVVTRCGHYFCEGCALGRYRRDPSCAACGAGTNGVFNAAKKLQKLLQKKKEREERRKREARERGEEVSEDEEEEDGEEEG